MSDIVTSVPPIANTASTTSTTFSLIMVPQVSVDPPTVGLVIPKLVVGLAMFYPRVRDRIEMEEPLWSSLSPCRRRVVNA